MPRKGKLRLKSLYALYQRLFGYTSTSTPEQRKNFASAIGQSTRIMARVFAVQSTDPIEAYKHEKHHPQAARFLDNFATLLANYPDAFSDWRFVDSEISLAGHLFQSGSKDGIVITFQYIYNPSGREIIVPTFGPPRQGLDAELGVLLILLELGTITPAIPPFVKTGTYWDVSSGNEHSISIASIQHLDRKSVIEACCSLMD